MGGDGEVLSQPVTPSVPVTLHIPQGTDWDSPLREAVIYRHSSQIPQIEQDIRRVLLDPGSVTGRGYARGEYEDLVCWQARAWAYWISNNP